MTESDDGWTNTLGGQVEVDRDGAGPWRPPSECPDTAASGVRSPGVHAGGGDAVEQPILDKTARLEVFRGYVEAAAMKAGIGPVRVVLRRRGARASRRRGVDVVSVAPGILAASEQVQRCVAAHEVAHVALGHTSQRGQVRQRLAGLALAAGGVAVLIWMVTVLVGSGAAADFPDGLVGAAFLLAAVSAGAICGSAATQRERERAADDYAARRLGEPITNEVAAFFARTEPRIPWWLAWSRTHPTPADRAARCRDLATKGEGSGVAEEPGRSAEAGPVAPITEATTDTPPAGAAREPGR